MHQLLRHLWVLSILLGYNAMHLNSPQGSLERAKQPTQEQSISIKGKVVSHKGHPLAYVNIGIPKANIGTATNKQGNFSLQIPQKHQQDTLRFSAIGYHSRNIPIQKVKSLEKIQLREKVYSMDTFEVMAKNAFNQTEKLGMWKPLLGGGVAYQSEKGYKIVTKLNLEHERADLQKVRVWIWKNHDPNASMRVRVYQEKNGRPGQNLLKESLVKNVPKRKGWLTFDLSDQKILINSDFYAGVEFLGASNTIPYVGTRIMRETEDWDRQASQGQWKKSANNYVVQAFVKH